MSKNERKRINVIILSLSLSIALTVTTCTITTSLLRLTSPPPSYHQRNNTHETKCAGIKAHLCPFHPPSSLSSSSSLPLPVHETEKEAGIPFPSLPFLPTPLLAKRNEKREEEKLGGRGRGRSASRDGEEAIERRRVDRGCEERVRPLHREVSTAVAAAAAAAAARGPGGEE